MVTYFRIHNFRSVVKLVVDFRFGEKRAPNGYLSQDRLPFLEQATERVVPLMAMFGPNAAGKSNIARAFTLLRQLVTQKKLDVRSLTDFNLIVPCGDATLFELGFVEGENRYVYCLEYGHDGVYRESLSMDGKEIFFCSKEDIRLDRLVSRTYTRKRLLEIIKVECCAPESGAVIRPLLNCIGIGYANLNEAVATAFRFFAIRLDSYTNVSMQTCFPHAVQMLQLAANIEQDEAVRRIVSMVRKLDVEILDIKIAENPNGPDKMFAGSDYLAGRHDGSGAVGLIVQSTHKNINGDNVFFRFMQQESEGTKRLASLMGYLLAAVEKGSTVVVDEFDLALHPLVVKEVLSLFQNRSRNPRNAQLVFTTHMTDILDDNIMRMSEIGLVVKNRMSGTRIRRIVDMRECGESLRNVTNFRKQYMDGWYQAIPHPAI